MKIILLTLILSIQSTFAAEGEVGLKDWLKGMRQELPKVVCREDGYYASCFEGGANLCSKEISSALEICVTNAHLPNRIDTEKNGRELSEKLGNCTGVKAEARLTKLKDAPEKCKDIKRWFL